MITTVSSDGDDLVLDIPKEMLEQLHWTEGDTIEWIENEDGSFVLKKV